MTDPVAAVNASMAVSSQIGTTGTIASIGLVAVVLFAALLATLYVVVAKFRRVIVGVVPVGVFVGFLALSIKGATNAAQGSPALARWILGIGVFIALSYGAGWLILRSKYGHYFEVDTPPPKVRKPRTPKDAQMALPDLPGFPPPPGAT